MEIIQKLLTINPYSRPGEKLRSVKNIVIHWVGNANSSAIANRNYFESCKNKGIYASSQYIIGLKGEIIQCVPEDEVAYHAGNRTVNRNSIGIENCHSDWNGKFNDATYNSLVELCANICKKYGLNSNALIRHYDVTGKDCPHYYVQNTAAWAQLKNDVQNKIDGTVTPVVPEGGDEPVRVYQNGSTPEKVYADTSLTKQIGTLSKYERCDCFGIFNDRAMVRYNVSGTNNYKIGFVKWTGGVK